MKQLIGADMGAVSSFVPWLGILGGAMGGGSKPAAGDSEAVKLMKMQLEQQERARREAEARNRMIMYGAFGVGILGAVYLLIKK